MSIAVGSQTTDILIVIQRVSFRQATLGRRPGWRQIRLHKIYTLQPDCKFPRKSCLGGEKDEKKIGFFMRAKHSQC